MAYFQTSSEMPRRGRGLGAGVLALIEAAYEWLADAHPTTGRGVGYHLFTRKLIASMDEMPRVYYALGVARERALIPWEWIVDEVRELEGDPGWDDPAAYLAAVRRSYARNFWAWQPHTVQVWSEKGTVRGVLRPLLDEYGVQFLPVHGWNSKATLHKVAATDPARPLQVLYVGDYDPSGMRMSEDDDRLQLYGGHHVTLRRIALRKPHCRRLGDGLSFPASAKRQDPNYHWFVERYGDRCWELDALDPRELRRIVEREITRLITDPDAWARAARAQQAEQDTLEHMLARWPLGK